MCRLLSSRLNWSRQLFYQMSSNTPETWTSENSPYVISVTVDRCLQFLRYTGTSCIGSSLQEVTRVELEVGITLKRRGRGEEQLEKTHWRFCIPNSRETLKQSSRGAQRQTGFLHPSRNIFGVCHEWEGARSHDDLARARLKVTQMSLPFGLALFENYSSKRA
nr:Biomphalaria glabrata protocadherin alpha-1-like; transcript variant X1 [Biomphalaria glabrata]